jgi:hypothetical protein
MRNLEACIITNYRNRSNYNLILSKTNQVIPLDAPAHRLLYNIKKYIDERLPEDYEKCLIGLNAGQYRQQREDSSFITNNGVLFNEA